MTMDGLRVGSLALLLSCAAALAFAGCGGGGSQSAEPDGGSMADAGGGEDATNDGDADASHGNDGGADASKGSDSSVGADSGHEAGAIGDAGSDAPTVYPGYPAAFAPPPQVHDYMGPVLANPKIVPVFFANDDATFTAQLKSFVSGLGATPYFTAAVGEYGVSPATAHAPVMLTENAPAMIDDTAIQAWLQGKLNGNDPLWPANDANTVYVLHYPAGTTITLGGQASCAYFGGYHYDVQLDANHSSAYVAYAVVPRCTSFGNLMGIDAVSGAESHEIAESVTDPYPKDEPAYAAVDEAHYEWERVLGGGEVGDMCAQFPNAFTKFAGFNYTVQRIWSNLQATAGNDPCQPALPGEVYFNSSLVLTDDVTMNVGGQMLVAKGVNIPLGQSKTIPVELFSNAPTTGPWTVTAQNATSTQYLAFSFDKTSGVNGDVLNLTITVNSAPTRAFESFLVKSALNGQDNFWIGVVGNPAVDGGAGDGGSAEGGSTDGGAAESGATEGGPLGDASSDASGD